MKLSWLDNSSVRKQICILTENKSFCKGIGDRPVGAGVDAAPPDKGNNFQEPAINEETVSHKEISLWCLKVYVSWKTVALFDQLIELKDHLDVCLPYSTL